MPGNQPGGEGQSAGSNHLFSWERRKLLASLGLTGVAGLAGCGGDGGGDGGGGTTAPPGTGTSAPGSTTAGPGPGTGTSPPGSTTEGTGGTETKGTETGTSTEAPWAPNRTWSVFVRPPGPGNAQYNPANGTVFWAPGGHMMRFKVYQKSFVNGEFQPEVAKDWNYRVGVLDLDFFQDHYFASDRLGERNPVNINADDFIKGTYQLKNWMWGEQFPRIDSVEKQGEYQLRVRFNDTYRKEFAMTESLSGFEVDNYDFYKRKGWIERFKEASSNAERDQIGADLQQKKYFSPHPFTSVPWYVSGTTETTWNLKLRNDETEKFGLPENPRWVDETNWPECVLRVSGETSRARVAFVNGKLPYAGSEMGGIQVVDADVPFNTTVEQVPRPHATGAYVFNVGKAPMSNVHFRRAFAYMLNRKKSTTRFMEGDQVITGFLTRDREEKYLSSNILDTLETGPHQNYGYAKAMKEEAEAEMKAGGFERNSNGMWVYQSGQRAGQPMSFKIPCYPWQQAQMNNSTRFQEDMKEFGITVNVYVQTDADLWGRFSDGDYEIGLAYWGGGNPTATYTNAYWGNPAIYGATNWPGQWEGPVMGEFATPVDDASEEMTTYNIAQLTQRLQLTRNDQQYQEIANKLAWVYNQSLPRVPIGFQPRTFVMNTDQWNWPLPFEDYPFAWVSLPRRKLWQRGVIKAIPTDKE
ncbi:MAG: ABC transporter substrate-binding protein [Halobacteriaceae archaeon]